MQDDLNPGQRKAVETLSGPLLVLAGAGSGKTRVVTLRIANLIRHGTVPSRILAVTFTNKAAAEMQERIAKLLGKRRPDRPVVATFHAYCLKILRRHIKHLGYPDKFTIFDRGEQESVARQVLRDIRVPGELLRPSDLLYYIGRWKTACIRPGAAAAAASNDKEHAAAAGYRRYHTALKNYGAVDFDDLLLLTEDLFSQYPKVRQEEAERFDHLLIDEYQDTNGSQYRIVKALAQHHRNLCVVGDDDQSIYAWRGAEVEHILRFQKDWSNATVVWLEHNYRSTKEILDLANRLIAFNKVRHPKVLLACKEGGDAPHIEQCPSEDQEARWVVGDIGRRLKEPGAHPRHFAILFRTNEQPRVFETELRRAGIPYVLIGGMSFFDRKEVRDILAYLRVLETPHDEISLLRIINTPARGVSAKSVEHLLSSAVAAGRPIWQEMQSTDTQSKLTDNARKAVREFVAMMDYFRLRLQREPLVQVARELIAQIRYQSDIERLYPDVNEQQARWTSVEQLVNALTAYEQEAKHPTLTDFLDDVMLGGRDFDNEKDNQMGRNAIVLMTLHSAKGLEFPYVYMVGLEEGILPHHRSLGEDDKAIEEERRLCYVGITRARQRLTLSLSLTRLKWGKARDTVPSRFLFELTGRAQKALLYRQIVTGAPQRFGAAAKKLPPPNTKDKPASATGKPPKKSATRRRPPGK